MTKVMVITKAVSVFGKPIINIDKYLDNSKAESLRFNDEDKETAKKAVSHLFMRGYVLDVMASDVNLCNELA